MKFVRALLVGVFIALLAAANTVQACAPAVGLKAASEVQELVNKLVSTHASRCVPAAASDGRCNIVCSSDARVANFDNWMLVAAAAAGKTAREQGLGGFDSLGLMDRELGQQRRYVAIDIAKASAMQADLAANRIEPPVAFQRVKAAAAIKQLPQ